MKQAEDLMSRRVYKEADQLYSRIHDIVSSFSPENSPMIDVVNRKFAWSCLYQPRKLELYTRSNRIADAVALIKKMNKNVDSRNDPIEAQIEKREFVNVLLNLGQITEAGLYSKEVFF